MSTENKGFLIPALNRIKKLIPQLGFKSVPTYKGVTDGNSEKLIANGLLEHKNIDGEEVVVIKNELFRIAFEKMNKTRPTLVSRSFPSHEKITDE